MVINLAKDHPGEMLLINGSKRFEKGRAKDHLTDEHISAIADVFLVWKQEDGLSAVVATEEAVRNDYNLSPSRYVATDDQQEVLPLEDAVVLLREAEEERAKVDEDLRAVLKDLGFHGSV